MLASIMPGLREIRTPLAAGYSWMLVAYLAFAYRLPQPDHATGPLADLYRIGRLVSPVGIAVSLSVVAYLVGVVVLSLTSALTKVVLKWRDIAPYWLTNRLPGKSPQDQIEEAFDNIAIDRLADRVRDDAEFRAALVRHGLEVGRLTGAEIDEHRLDEILRKDLSVRRRAVDEARDDAWQLGEVDDILPLMVQRMRGQDSNFATEYDRLTTEAEFRAGMAWPLLVLLVVLAVRSSIWWLCGLPAVLLLISSASGASLQATLLLSTVVATRRYDEPAMQVLDSVPAEQLLDRTATTAFWASSAARTVTELAISPDNTTIAGGTDDGYLLLWDVATGDLRRSFAAHRGEISAVAFSPDGTYLVTSGHDNGTYVWDCTSGERVRVLDQKQWIWYLAFDSSTRLLVGTGNDSIMYWDITDGAQVQRRTFRDPDRLITASMGHDGTLAVGLSDDSMIAIRGDQVLDTVKTGDLRSCRAVSSTMFVTVEFEKNKNVLNCWRDSGVGLVKSSLPVPWEPYAPVVVAHCESTAKVIFTTLDDDIVLLDLDSDVAPQICGTHAGIITTLAAADDFSILVSASRAGTVHVIDPGSGKLLLRLVPQVEATGTAVRTV